MYSLMSSGSQYQAPGQSRGQSRHFMSSSSSRNQALGLHRAAPMLRPAQFSPVQYAPATARASGARHRGSPVRSGAAGLQGSRGLGPQYSTVNASVPAFSEAASARTSQLIRSQPVTRAQHQPLRTAPEPMLVSREHAQTDQSIPGPVPALERDPEAPVPFPALNEDSTNDVSPNALDVANDDPRNPFTNHRNSVFYNLYPSRARPAVRAQRPPGTGYGTRFFQNGQLHFKKNTTQPHFTINQNPAIVYPCLLCDINVCKSNT